MKSAISLCQLDAITVLSHFIQELYDLYFNQYCTNLVESLSTGRNTDDVADQVTVKTEPLDHTQIVYTQFEREMSSMNAVLSVKHCSSPIPNNTTNSPETETRETKTLTPEYSCARQNFDETLRPTSDDYTEMYEYQDCLTGNLCEMNTSTSETLLSNKPECTTEGCTNDSNGDTYIEQKPIEQRLNIHQENNNEKYSQINDIEKDSKSKAIRPLVKPLSSAKVHKCSQCSESFSERAHLAEHIKTHYLAIKPTAPCKCPVCPIEFTYAAQLMKHIYSVHEKRHGKRYMCRFCNIFYDNIALHYKTKHLVIQKENTSKEELGNQSEKLKKSSWFKCNSCGKRFAKCEQLNLHSQLCTKGNFTCNINGCKKQFSKRWNLIKHKQSHNHQLIKPKPSTQLDNSETPTECEKGLVDDKCVPDRCNDSEDRPITLILSSKKIFKCSKCPASFPESDILVQHIQTHYRTLGIKMNPTYQINDNTPGCAQNPDAQPAKAKPEETQPAVEQTPRAQTKMLPHKCPVCLDGFIDVPRVLNHIISEHKRGDGNCYPCPLCNVNYKSLNLHIQDKHVVKMWQCDLCPSRFASEESLRTHKLAYHEEKSHQCHICGKMFSGYQQRIRHSKICKEKPYLCTFDRCIKRFCTEAELNKHAQSHFVAKRSMCRLCNILVSNVTTHRRTHHADKSYVCPDCGKAFSLKNALVCHMKIHTSDKSYKCDHCGKCFADKMELSAHGCSQNQKTFQCQFCEEHFLHGAELQEHLKTHLI